MILARFFCVLLFFCTVFPVIAQVDEHRLVIAVDQMNSSIFPYQNLSEHSLFVSHMVFDPLFRWQADQTLAPRLVASWKSLSSTVMRLRLKKGVQFHSGHDLTSMDIAWTFKQIKRHKESNQLFSVIKSINVVTPYQFDIVTRSYDPYLLQRLSYFFPLDSRYYSQHRDHTKYASGTGPFRLSNREPGIKTELIKYNQYWDHQSSGNVSALKIIPVMQDDVRVQAFIAGDLDIISSLSSSAIARLEPLPAVKLVMANPMQLIFLQINHQHPLLKNRLVRVALANVIDVAAIIGRIAYGHGIAAHQLSPKGAVGFDASFASRFDPLKGVETLSALLKKSAEPIAPLTISLRSSSNYDQRLALILALMIERLGVTVNKQTEQTVDETATAAKCAPGIAISEWHFKVLDTKEAIERLFISPTKQGRAAVANCSYYSNSELNAVIKQLKQKTDLTQRTQLLRQAEKLLYDDVAFIPLYWKQVAWAARSDLSFESAFGPLAFPYMGEMRIHGSQL